MAIDGDLVRWLMHSKNTASENVTEKLADLGLHAGMAPLDERMQPFRCWIADEIKKNEGMLSLLFETIITAGLGDSKPNLAGRII